MSVSPTLLGLLEREPNHGYDLKRDYDAHFGRGRPLRYSQVYATLSRLEADLRWIDHTAARLDLLALAVHALSNERRSALRRDRFGFVFQSGQLVPELTAGENVALPLLLSGTRRGPAMTAALDSVSGELVMDLLVVAAREHGATVVLVTHDARVAAYAGREVVVRDGTVSTLTWTQP